MRSTQEIRDWLLAKLRELTERDGDHAVALNDRVVFREVGIDSVRAAQLVAALGKWIGRDLDVTMLYDHPTVGALADALTGAAPQASAHFMTRQNGAAIAIVGIGCRFAGADGVEAFWDVLRNNVDAIGVRPAARGHLPQSRHWSKMTRGDACFREGGYLAEIDRFDARFFGISEAEATRMDPQQRLLLEVTYDALVDAAIAPSTLRGSSTGVYVGISTADYGVDQLGAPLEVDVYTGSGSAASVAANRLSYFFDFQGPSLAIDTACSSSAVAIHEACLAIRRGEIGMAIAAGVNVILSPAVTMNFVQAGVMAADARCKTFSEAADGYVRAEGVGVIVLKPLAQAQADGDRVYAVVLGGAVNHGGRTNGLLSPSGRGQALALAAALRDASVTARDLDYIEAHGTGTFIGDPIEVNALGRALSVGLARARKCLIGSVKTNIGHTEAAAGIASVIKVALSLYHRTIPASLHAEQPNKQIYFTELPITVATVNRAWPGRPGHACASVASVGFGGTNCHLVLAEPGHPVAQSSAPGGQQAAGDSEPAGAQNYADDPPWMLPVSAATAAGLCRSVAAWASAARAQVVAGTPHALRAIIDRTARGRDHHAYRAGFCAADPAALVRALAAGVASGGERGSIGEPRRDARAVFVHAGQGSQWLGMGRQLLAYEPVFRTAFAACDQALQPFSRRSVLDLALHDEQGEYLTEIELVQPMLFTFQVAFAALWRSYGIEPAAVIGHSMGEVAAAHVAGVLSLDDAARIIALRSQLMTRVRGRGMMAFVELSLLDALEVIAPYEGRVSLAASNSPNSTVLSGEAEPIREILDVLAARGMFARPIRVDVASHSAQVDPILDDLLDLLAPIRPQAARTPMWSTVLGCWVQGPELDAGYWVRNLRGPVRFAEAIAGVADARSVFIELSPHPVLVAPVEQCLHHAGLQGPVVPTARRDRDERLTVAEALTVLYQAGCDVVWPVQSTGTVPVLPWAPGYAWDDQRYWWNPSAGPTPLTTVAAPVAPRPATTPTDEDAPWESAAFWHSAMESAMPGSTRIWQFTVGRSTCGVTACHQVAGRVVLPATLFLTLSVQAAAEVWGIAPQAIGLDNVLFVAPVVVEPPKQVQIIFADTSALDRPGSTAVVKMFARTTGEWELASEASLQVVAGASNDTFQLDLPRYLEGSSERYSDHLLYEELGQLGVQYGAHFQCVKAVWRWNGAALGLIVPTSEVAAGEPHYAVHPALIDAAFHLAWAALEPEVRAHALRAVIARIPAAIERVRIWQRGSDSNCNSWATVQRRPDDTWEVSLFDQNGAPRMRIEGLRLAAVSAESFAGANLADACFSLVWRDRPLDHVPTAPRSWLIVGDPTDQFAHELRTELVARGHRTRLTWEPAAAEPEQNVLYLPMLYDGSDATDGCTPLMALAQAFARGEHPSWQSLTIVTRCAQAVRGTAVLADHAPLWGMGRVIAAELPAWTTRLIDLEIAHAVGQLADELVVSDPEVALRAGLRYVPRLVPSAAPAPAPAVAVRLLDDATYLVTGGSGALGSSVARRLVQQGAGCVLLCGRRGEPSPDVAAWLAVEPRGRYLAVDVTDRAAVVRVIAEIQASGRPLRGVIHAAGLLQDATIEQLTAAQLAAVMGPKREGLWNLHLSTAELALDFFVVFSSAAALIGSPGQANYAAANTYVDQLCYVRRASGKPALTINWGPWAEVGLAAHTHRGERLAAFGVQSVAPEAGVSYLIELIGRGEQGQIVIMPLDRELLRIGALAGSPVLAELVGTAPVLASPNAAVPPPGVPAPASARGGMPLEALLQENLAAVLRRPSAEIDVETPFPQLGIESLEVLRFKSRIEVALGLILPATVVWKHPTIRMLAEFLEAEMGKTPRSL